MSDPCGRVAKVVSDQRVSVAKPAGKPGGGGGTVTQPNQSVPTGISRIGALSATSTASINGDDSLVDVDVAVIDTGIDLTHPDLNVVDGKNCVRNGSTDDGNGHGTHVAGTIGARDNGIGVVGVAPGARLWPVRVLDNRGSGTWSQVICGIDYVTENAAVIKVANMSLGGGGTEKGCEDGGMQQAICAAVGAGVTFVVAAGNDAKDAAGFVPAAYDQVITVSALADSDGAPGGTWAEDACRADEEESLANFSNYGADVDLIAPGVCIRSTWKDGGYNTISGTSMAAPHVAGAAALYRATTDAGPDAVRDFLVGKASPDWSRNVKDPAGSLTLTQEPLLDVTTF
jgi:subtilisin